MEGERNAELLARELARTECAKITDEAILERLAAAPDAVLAAAATARLESLAPSSADAALASYSERLRRGDRAAALRMLARAEAAFPADRRVMRARLHMSCELPTPDLLALARGYRARFPDDRMLLRFIAALEHEEKIVTLVPELRRKALEPATN